jgi:hypothetical protein
MRWGAIAVGAVAGLVVTLLAFIFLGVSGLVTVDRGQIWLLFMQFLALVVAGYVAGRLTGAPTIHGALAGVLTAVVSGIVSSRLSTIGVAALTLVAAILGAAGGVLARWQREMVEQ